MTTSIIKKNNGNAISRPVSNWVDRLLNENLNRFFNDDLLGYGNIERQMYVPINLRETDKSYELALVVPGLHKKDFNLNVTNDQLTISYEQKEEEIQEDKSEGWLRKEYMLKSFSRSFTLDDTIDQNKIEANYENGILLLTIPKKENAQRLSKNIEVK